MLNKFINIGVVVFVLLLFKIGFVSAENGCGGNMWCGDSKDYVTYDCREVPGVDKCEKNDTGIDSAECFSGANYCRAITYTYSCPQDQSTLYLQSHEVSCCTDGSGTGNIIVLLGLSGNAKRFVKHHVNQTQEIIAKFAFTLVKWTPDKFRSE